MQFIFFDVETTGLTPKTCQIIELAAIKTSPDGGIIDKYYALVKADAPLPAKITELTGHTDAELNEKGIPLKDALVGFYEWTGPAEDSYLVAHNAPFDAAFLRENSIRESVQVPNYKVIDTLHMSRKFFPHLKKHKLGLLLEHHGIVLENAHTADADTEGLYRLFKLIVHQRQLNKETFTEFIESWAKPIAPMAELNDTPPWLRKSA